MSQSCGLGIWTWLHKRSLAPALQGAVVKLVALPPSPISGLAGLKHLCPPVPHVAVAGLRSSAPKLAPWASLHGHLTARPVTQRTVREAPQLDVLVFLGWSVGRDPPLSLLCPWLWK